MSGAIPKLHIITFGCKVNQCDAEELAQALAQRGCPVEIGHESDSSFSVQRSAFNVIYIINTCSVTSTADAKARKLIRRLAKEHPQARIIVTGCYAERAADEIGRLGENIRVVSNREKERIPELIAKDGEVGGGVREPRPRGALRSGGLYEGRPQRPEPDKPACEEGGPFGVRRRAAALESGSLLPPEQLPTSKMTATKSSAPTHRTRAFIKIQDGCDHVCAYCIVHSLRGPMHSKPLSQAIADISRACANGAKEVVLCGIRLGAYGKDQHGGAGLATLLHSLRERPLPRLRLSSIEPLDISDDLIDEIADQPSLCHHLHLPLQSGDDGVLAAMQRGYSMDNFRRLAERLRTVWPDLSITTDIMVGFPGEDDAAFAQTLAAIREFDFSKVHVFRFSPRPGTPAATLPHQVSEQVKRARLEAVQRLTDELFQSRAQRLQDETVEVLIEQRNSATGRWEGLTPHYLRVELAGAEWSAGEIVSARISGAGRDFLIGE